MPTKKEVKMKMLLDKKFRKHSVVYRAEDDNAPISSVYLKKTETLRAFDIGSFPEEITIIISIQ